MVLWSLLGLTVFLILALAVFAKVPLVYNLRNLSLRWRTTVLTAAAFTLVIGLLVVMLAFVNGMKRLTEASGNPSNVLVLASGTTDEAFSNLSIDDVREIETLPEILRDKDGKPWVSRETYMFAIQSIPDAPPGRPKRRYLQIRGLADAAVAAKVHDAELKEGTWFSESGSRLDSAAEGEQGGEHGGRASNPSDTPQPMIEVVLGEGIARQLGHDRSGEQLESARNRDRFVVGDTFFLGEEDVGEGLTDASGRPVRRATKWVVVGILDSAGTTFGSELWAKQSLVAPLFGKDTFTSLLVRVKDPETARKLKNFLNNDFKKVSVDSHIEREYYASLTELTTQFLVAIIVVTVFVSVGGVFGVMNTMFAAISQRIKDIGVLRLLGYARWQILFSFLLESLLIALVGGVAGCLLGMVADGWTATSIITGQSGGGKFVVLKLVVDPSTLATGTLIALVMGLIGGLLPALAAMRLKPLDALR
jgi:ABC-type lipoprotein release transport system permease subunit